MGAISQSLGQGADLTFEGKTYTLAPWDLSIQGAFEKYLEAEIIAGARRAAAYLSPDEASAVLARVAEKIGLKKYTFGTPEVGEALSSPVHMQYMVFLQLKKNHPEVTRDLVKKMAESMWSDIIEASNRANGHDAPNAETPSLTEGETKTPTTSSETSAAV